MSPIFTRKFKPGSFHKPDFVPGNIDNFSYFYSCIKNENSQFFVLTLNSVIYNPPAAPRLYADVFSK